MSPGRASTFSTLAAFFGVLLPAGAQSVISTHSGLIHYFEGAVYLGDQSLESRPGRFPSVPQGGELRTVAGRAEVLLTPGVFLRMGDQSVIRMIANDLSDTQVELETGSVIVDSGEPNLNTSVTLLYKNWKVHVLRKGVYRIDADPPRLWVRQGQAEVFTGASNQPVSVEAGMRLPFAGVLVPERTTEPIKDALNDWSTGRGESITADNTITAQLDQDPAAGMPADGFTYYPLLGLSSIGPAPVGGYSSYLPSQPGFYSIYLPGYTYRPLLLGTMGVGIGRRYPAYPLSLPRVGVSPGAGYISPLPRAPLPIVRPGVIRPGMTQPGVIQPGLTRPGVTHAPAPIGVHGGVHR
jgi:hypothetical protein